MPLEKCSTNGASGFRWGKSGKCYIGKDGKKKAIKQGIAEMGPDKFQSEMMKSNYTECKEVLLDILGDIHSSINEINLVRKIIFTNEGRSSELDI